MSSPIRVNDSLYREAEAEGELLKRSAAKQVEFWAELGKQVAHSISPANVLALLQGAAELRVINRESLPQDPGEVFNAVKEASTSGYLGERITKGVMYYEASQQHPGFLDRVMPDGSRQTGKFSNGKFTEAIMVTDRR